MAKENKKSSKMAGLTFRQKLGYIRDYYTLHIVAGLVLFAVVGWGINHFIINPPPATFINVSFYGVSLPRGFTETIRSDLEENLTCAEGYVILVDNFYYGSDTRLNLTMHQRFGAMVATGQLDVLLVAPGEVERLYNFGFARNLNEVFMPWQLEQLYMQGLVEYGQEHIFDLAGQVIGYKDVIPMGVRLDRNPFFGRLAEQYGGSFDEWVMIVVTNSKREAAVGSFLDYIFGYG